MSTTHETPIVAPEATAPTSTVEKAALISTVEPIVETTKPVTAAEPTITEPSTTEAAPITETTKDTKAEEFVKVEAPPITSGNLGYKTGPLKLFKYSQRYFWLGDEAPLEDNTISHFHKGNHENKHHTAAHASQTGKGLLLYAKRAEDKTHPEGIFNLSEVTDVVKEGFYDFSFKFHDKKQSFQATKSSERDGWLAAINNAVTEASGAKENLRGTDGYKSNYKKYMLTSGVAGVGAGAVGAAAIAKDVKNDDKVHNGTIAPTTTAAAGTTTTKKSTSRSRSRGPLGLFRQTKEKTEANIVHAKEEAGIKKEEKPEEKKAEEVALIGPGSTAAVVPATHAKDTVDTAKTPLKEKRTSRFGSAGNIFGSSKKSTDVKPTTEPVAAEAPKVDSPVESGASLTESVPTQAATTTTHAPVVESAPVASEPAVVAAATAPAATTSEPKKSTEKSPSRGIRGFFAKKEAQGEKKIEEKKIEKEEKKAVESTTESTPIVGGIGKTPFAQAAIPTAVAATAAGAAGAATAATSTATNTATATTNAATAATDATTATTEAVITKPVVDSIATGSGTATGAITNAGTTKKEERRRSIFDTFKSKPKPVSDTKETTSETTSPAGVDESKEKKMFNLFRSSSKKASHEPTSSTAGAPPVPAKDAEVPTATTTTAEATAAKAETPIATETKPEVSSIATEVPTEHAAITSATPVHPTAA